MTREIVMLSLVLFLLLLVCVVFLMWVLCKAGRACEDEYWNVLMRRYAEEERERVARAEKEKTG